MSLTIPVTIAALLPLLATALSSWLNDDHLPQGINALISLTAILLTAIGCELLSADIPLAWTLRLVGVLAYVGILMQGDLSVLYQYLVAKPSPVSSGKPAPTPTQSVVSKAYQPPIPIVLPPDASPVPPRASQQPPQSGA